MTARDDDSSFQTLDPDSEEVVVMLEALAGASAELEHVSQRLSDQLNRVGSRMRKTLLNEIRLSKQRVDNFLTSYLTSSTRDRDRLLTELSQYRHSEIRSILKVGEDCRAKLTTEVEGYVNEYSSDVRKELAQIKTTIGSLQSEREKEKGEAAVTRLAADNSEKIQTLFASLIKRLPELPREKLDVVDPISKSISTTAQQSLTSLISKLKTDLDSISESSASEIARNLAQQKERFAEVEQRLVDFQAGLQERFQSHWGEEEVDEYFAELVKSFQESLATVCELQSGAYQSRLMNVAHQARLDIMTSSRSCCEEMRALQTEFAGTMAEQQRKTWDRCDSLMEKLEKAIDDQVGSGDTSGTERMRSALKNMHLEFRGRTAKKAHQMEMYFERTADSVIKNVEILRDDAIEKLEQEFAQARREFADLFEDVERRLSDIQKQTSKIEKAGFGVSSLISAIKQSEISFGKGVEE